MSPSLATLFAVFTAVAAQTITTSEPALADIKAAAATAIPRSPTSDVPGVAFNRFFQIWLENTDYSSAAGDENQKWLASQGITLTNYFGAGHVSEPNYVAAAAGDNFGMDNDNFHQIPANISTVADLLAVKGISWGEYQEGLPYAGFQGFNYSNQTTYANDYVRKHNPLIIFDSITDNATLSSQIKNFTDFYSDLENQKLPQWAFITPNMTNDGHDTDVAFASKWLRPFVENLMNNTYFWNDTLLLLTFDESEHYPVLNRVFSILLGGAVPKSLVGTVDDTVYSHYSTISSISANWGLPSLGRWDCGANLFQLVANKTGYTNWNVDPTNLYINVSLPGPLSANSMSTYRASWPIPATNETCSGGNGILPAVVDAFKGQEPTYNYTAPFPYDTSADLNVNVTFSRNSTTLVSGVNSTSTTEESSTTTTSSGAQTTTSKGAAANLAAPSMGMGFAALVLAAFL